MPIRKILVVDDSTFIRRTIKDMLAASSFEIIEAENGVEGLKLIRSACPDLILLDFVMPQMGGWEVYQEMRKSNELRTIPLVFMSARKEEITEKIAEPFKYFAFIPKPFDQKQLVAAIKEAMKKCPPLEPVGDEPPVEGASDAASATEIAALQKQVKAMQGEIDALKRQFHQLVGFIKQKIK